jgi:hypothetical protein
MNSSYMAAHHVDSVGTPLATNADILNGESFLPPGAAAVRRFARLILMGIGLVDPEKLATVGRERGHQVLVKRNDSEYGLYTVSQIPPGEAGQDETGDKKHRRTKNAPANSRPAYERAALVARQVLGVPAMFCAANCCCRGRNGNKGD